MKVLQLGKFYPIRGGVEKVMYHFMEGLSERGFDCDMLCAMESGPTRKIVLGEHASLIGTRSLTKRKATMISPAMISKLRKICNSYDIIHIHHPDPMAALALLLSGYKGKVVLHWHSDIVHQRILLNAYKGLQNWLIRRADVVVGTSPKYIAESPHLRGAQHKAMSLPIGILPMQPDHDGAQDVRSTYRNKKIIFSLGRLVPYKGFEYLIDAAALLPDDYVVLIGGEGPLQQKLQDRIRALDIDRKVKLLGYLRDDELPAYFTACDLFALTSIQKNEAFGIVLIEAMSMGKPVVATRIPESGVSWVNADGQSGINVAPASPIEFADAIRRILDHPDEQKRFSEGALRRYREVFTREKMIDGLIDIYDGLLSKMSPPPR